jgi:hypothetical protein
LASISGDCCGFAEPVICLICGFLELVIYGFLELVICGFLELVNCEFLELMTRPAA